MADNFAEQQGGAIRVTEGGKLRVEGGVLASNRAEQGGAVVSEESFSGKNFLSQCCIEPHGQRFPLATWDVGRKDTVQQRCTEPTSGHPRTVNDDANAPTPLLPLPAFMLARSGQFVDHEASELVITSGRFARNEASIGAVVSEQLLYGTPSNNSMFSAVFYTSAY